MGERNLERTKHFSWEDYAKMKTNDKKWRWIAGTIELSHSNLKSSAMVKIMKVHCTGDIQNEGITNRW